MDANQLIVPPDQHVLVNLAPSVMVLPNVFCHILLNDTKYSNEVFRRVKSGESPYVFAVMSDPRIKESPEKFYKTGVIAETRLGDGGREIILVGLFRAEMVRLRRIEGDNWLLWTATIKKIEDENRDDYFINSQDEVEAKVIEIRHLLVSFMTKAKGVCSFNQEVMEWIVHNFEVTDWTDKDAVDNFIWSIVASVPDLLQKDKQPFLESTSLPERIDLCIKTLKQRLRFLEIQLKNESGSRKDGNRMKRSTRVPVLDSENKNNKPDTDEDDFVKGAHEDILKMWNKLKEVREYIGSDAISIVTEDIKRLVSIGDPHGNSYEWPKFMGRLEFVLGLPWKEETVQEGDISKVAHVLDEDHYGLVYVKDSICDQLAPKLLNPEGKGHILCLVGPPGVGKTSLAKSVARALNRKYIRISLGGVRDEAQIRGHKVTYIGSEAGEILKEIRRCGVKNPVFVIDEIDKLGHMSNSGDPSSAMLEVLDPEQNNSFKDHYVACGFDLSKVMFIATANVEDDIMAPLRDRMDIIRLPGYLEVEKIEIAKKYLIHRWMKEVGLFGNNVEVQWGEEAIPLIIRGYTHEAGVRNLERTIATILRKISREYLKSRNEEKLMVKFEVTNEKVHQYLGPPKYLKGRARPTMAGEAIGLAWTPVGGDILYVQAEFYDRLDGKKVLDLTGMQGDVMKESDKLALTRLRNVLREKNSELADKLKNNAIHLHIPEGAVPKDGPSAGVTIFSALYSEVTGRLVKQSLAMTGEIDNKGSVLAVGGIREKIVAAERAGIEEIIMPKDNERNLHDVPKEVKDNLKFNFVETVDQVLEIAFPSPLN